MAHFAFNLIRQKMGPMFNIRFSCVCYKHPKDHYRPRPLGSLIFLPITYDRDMGALRRTNVFYALRIILTDVEIHR